VLLTRLTVSGVIAVSVNSVVNRIMLHSSVSHTVSAAMTM